eukprot:scaffold25194_cov46-Cyclotella_meneghiniana.AAC.2
MAELGIVLDFKHSTIQLDHISLPMREIFKLQEKSKIDKAWAVNNSIMRDEPDSTKELTKRAVQILDAKYEKADLPDIVENQCQHLDAHQRKLLLDLLLEFEDLFDGTLGIWDTSLPWTGSMEGVQPRTATLRILIDPDQTGVMST